MTASEGDGRDMAKGAVKVAAGKAAGKAAMKGKGERAAQVKAKPATKAKPAAKTPAAIVSTGYWLLKSEPDVFSWEMQKARGAKGEPWTGVRNYLARNYMRAMRIGDLAFFYHSNIGKEIVGVVRVSGLAHPDADDDTGTWECVDVVAECDMPRAVTLVDVKANPALATMALVTSMRLSVQPVTAEQWAEVCAMGGLDHAKLL